jgi:hypothetical protein
MGVLSWCRLDVSNGDHSRFLSHEADVLREVRAFAGRL